jgi:hypothetical protein
MNVLKPVVGVSLLLVAAAFAAADEPLMPQPTPEHEALAVWTGTWSGQGEMKPGPFGPGGKMTWTEECTWFEGSRFNVVCKSDGTSPAGPMKGLAIIGYSPGKQVYTHYGVDNTGWSGYSEGTREGDSWTFRSSEEMGGTTYHTRFEMTWIGPKNMTFKWEMSEDGTSWVVVMDGTSEKK